MARLAPGVTQQQAEAQLAPVFRRAAYEHLNGKPKAGEKPVKLELVPARGLGEDAEGYKQPLYLLLAIVGVILAIACGNVAMLLAARNANRRREFSIRVAVGGVKPACSANCLQRACCYPPRGLRSDGFLRWRSQSF